MAASLLSWVPVQRAGWSRRRVVVVEVATGAQRVLPVHFFIERFGSGVARLEIFCCQRRSSERRT